jgi:hypothetical protein
MANPQAPEIHALVCIDHPPHRLYAELIQVVEARQIAWLRPWALVTEELDAALGSLDLRQGPDLLLPAHLIRPALDTELLGLLSQLAASPPTESPLPPQHRQQLHQLIQQLCRLPAPDPMSVPAPFPLAPKYG